MGAYGEDYKTNPIPQLKWCTALVRDKYGGDWTKALDTLKKYGFLL